MFRRPTEGLLNHRSDSALECVSGVDGGLRSSIFTVSVSPAPVEIRLSATGQISARSDRVPRLLQSLLNGH